MSHFLHVPYVLLCASLLLVPSAAALEAQRTASPTVDILTRMRADLGAKRYAAVIAEANAILESTRSISTPERLQLWQILAAAYYPDAPDAQQPDSAQLPLAALIRFVPDIKVAREISWPGLDALTERTRAESFAAVSRPQSAYTLSQTSPGYLTVVASRPTRFRLSSVSEATSNIVVHDSSGFETTAVLQLRSHDALAPIFTDGEHQLHVWAYDSISGDSLLLSHRVLAQQREVPAANTDDAEAVFARPAEQAVPVNAPPTVVRTHRSSMLWTGLALAAATAVIAQEARPDDGLRSAFRVDARAFAVGAAMAGAAVANFFTRQPPAHIAPTVTVTRPAAPRASTRPFSTYQVHLQIDPPVR